MINRQKHKSTDFKNRSVVYNKCLTNLIIISFLFLFETTKKHSTGKNLGYIRFFRSPRDVITHTLRDRFHFTGTMLICGTLGRRTIWFHLAVTHTLDSRINYN